MNDSFCYLKFCTFDVNLSSQLLMWALFVVLSSRAK